MLEEDRLEYESYKRIDCLIAQKYDIDLLEYHQRYFE
jgi:hypothetical protein